MNEYITYGKQSQTLNTFDTSFPGKDWSRMIVPGATIECLDKDAIAYARNIAARYSRDNALKNQIHEMNDEQFVTWLKLMQDGKITNAGLLLLGNPRYGYLFEHTPGITWQLIDHDGCLRDYKVSKIPFVQVTEKVYNQIRNLHYQYMANPDSLFPFHTSQYDPMSFRELLNNCIVHSDYHADGNIYVYEMEDKVEMINPGNFLPGNIENVLEPVYAPPYYRNQLLAEAMSKLHMIDTASSGIKSVYLNEKNRYFPLPDYDLSVPKQVSVTMYGKILDQNYTFLLYECKNTLDLKTVFLLDKVQKHQKITREETRFLKSKRLIKGKYPNLYIPCM